MNQHSPALTRAIAIHADANEVVARAVAVYDNPDSVNYRKAVAALLDGRAAYWSTCHHHNAKAEIMLWHLNEGAGIHSAMREAGFWRDAAHRVSSGLDCMVPLNDIAARQLSDAYADLGHLREPDELLARALRRMAAREAKRRAA